MALDDIVAYTYEADIYGPCCIIEQVAKGGAPWLRSYAPCAVQSATAALAEKGLDKLARIEGVNRAAEETFDSGFFPKVVLRDMIEDGERCGACGEELG